MQKYLRFIFVLMVSLKWSLGIVYAGNINLSSNDKGERTDCTINFQLNNSIDTVKICGKQYLLDAGAGFGSYSWSNGASSQSIIITSSGWYTCTVTSGGCTGKDSIFISIIDAKILNKDTVICRGNAITLKAPSPVGKFITDVSGNTYPVVKIGSQTWMQKNLTVNRYRNGDLIPQVADPSQWANLTTGAWCWYNNDSAGHEAVYGKLYNWYAVKDPRGLAPEGWHVPSEPEWWQLHYLNGTFNNEMASALKDTGTAYWLSPNEGATNSTGFTALPGGTRSGGSTFTMKGSMSFFWTNDIDPGAVSLARETALNYVIVNTSEFSGVDFSHVKDGLSVRCVKDDASQVGDVFSYLWSTGSTTSSIQVSPTQQTKYYCTINNSVHSCKDSITVLVKSPSSSSTNVTACSGYVWNGNTYATSGSYTYTTNNSVGCDSVATLVLTVNSAAPLIFTQDTVKVCGREYFLDAGEGYNSYLWNNGASTQIIKVTSTGWYRCTVTGTSCNGADSIFVSIIDARILNGDTSAICRGNGITLNASPANANYLWSTGSTASSIQVSPTQQTKYYCTINNGIHSCVDSVTVLVKNTSTSTTTVSACRNYSWNGNTYNSSGTYTYTTTNAVGCDSIATLQLTISNFSPQIFSQDSIKICSSDYQLDAGAVYNNYFWSNGASTKSIKVNSTGWYTCRVGDGICFSRDSIFVSIIGTGANTLPVSLCLNDSVTLKTSVKDAGFNMKDISGNSYPTVKIGNQIWSSRNLEVSRYRNGDIIPQVANPGEWENLTTGAWCWYKNDSLNFGTIYGKLYNWYAVNDPRGLAPEGWHIPTMTEWDTLFNNAGGTSVAGGNLKATGTIESGTGFWNEPNVGANNSTGFNALPGGFKFKFADIFVRVGGLSMFWSSVGSVANETADHILLSNEFDSVAIMGTYANDGFSVRCVKNDVSFNQGYTYQWSNQSTASSIRVSPAQDTKYFYSVNNGIHTCTDSIEVRVIKPEIQFSSTPILCYGGSSTVTVNAVGGVEPYAGTGNFIKTSGDHTFTITDAIGCRASSFISLQEPYPLNVVTKSTTAFRDSSGTASVFAFGGTPAYSYLWQTNPPQVAQTATGLASGIYEVTVTDANGCSVDTIVEVLSPAADDCTNAFRTHSQVGWAVTPNGNNAGTYLNENFSSSFPSGLSIGSCDNNIVLTSPDAIRAFLPSAASPQQLEQGILLNPDVTTYSNALAGELVALSLNLRFDSLNNAFGQSGILFGDAIIQSGSYRGQTIRELFIQANEALGCGASENTLIGYSEALSLINYSWENGVRTNDFVECPVANGVVNPPISNTSAEKILLYPNPASNMVNISYEIQKPGSVIISLHNALGYTILSLKKQYNQSGNYLTELLLTQMSLKPGIYFIRIQKEGNVSNKKLLLVN